MKRLLLLLTLIAVAFTAFADNFAEHLHRNHDLVFPGQRTYERCDTGNAKAPKGFKPFYATIYSRHGSRYDVDTTICKRCVRYLRTAEDMKILTPLGKEVLSFLVEAERAHGNRVNDLSERGYEQMRNLGIRMYDKYPEIFSQKGATIEGMASLIVRCAFSMVAFNEGLRERNNTLHIVQNASLSHQHIVRPQWDDPTYKGRRRDEYEHHKDSGEWKRLSDEWRSRQNCNASLSRMVTDADGWCKAVGETSYKIAYEIGRTLDFAHNYYKSCGDLLQRAYAGEDLLRFYKYQNFRWMNRMTLVDNPVVAYNISRSRIPLEDIMKRGNAAIAGTNRAVADIRFTHDTFILPLFVVLGEESCIGHNCDIEDVHKVVKITEHLCMASNLQIVLFRNKAGEVLVRCQYNEGDMTLPIKSDCAPFYRWEDFCNYINSRLAWIDEKAKQN